MADTPARYCSNCGHALNTGDRFCPNCGRPVQETATVPTPEADVPVPPPAQTGSFNTAAPQTSPRTSLRRELSDRRVAGGLIFLGVCFIGLCVAAATGNLDAQDVGWVAEEPKQERQAAQQEQPQKRDPQPQEEEQQAQGGQKEQQDDGGQEPEPPKPEPQKPEPQEPSFASFGDGTYQVGTDVQPGTYRTREGSPYCYWERLRNFSGGMNGILANGGTSNPSIVTISPTDAGFQSNGCGTWTKLQ